MLYLHETIDIRGDGSDSYLHAVLERAQHSEAQGISRLLGAWKVIGSTHRWPRVVNLWEMESWQHWADTLERQFLPERKDPHLAPWWRQMTRYRRGGFDRILEPLPGGLDHGALVASGKRAWVVEQGMYRTRPGAERLLLEEAVRSEASAREALGMWLLGAYRVPMRPGEGMVLWAAPEFATLCQWWDEAGQSSGKVWQRRLARLGARVEICWLAPAEGTWLDPRGGGATRGENPPR